MSERKNYYIDWWKIKKSSIYAIFGVAIFLSALVGGFWWAMKNNWFVENTASSNIPKDAARIISFEGDVRVTRASTRETAKVVKDTFLSAGDTIQIVTRRKIDPTSVRAGIARDERHIPAHRPVHPR